MGKLVEKRMKGSSQYNQSSWQVFVGLAEGKAAVEWHGRDRTKEEGETKDGGRWVGQPKALIFRVRAAACWKVLQT